MKQIFRIFSIIVLTLILGYVILNMIHLFTPKSKPSDSQFGKGIITNFTQDQANKLCNDSRLNIKDESNHYVKDVKKEILSRTKISKDYFDKHFNFLCGIDEPFVRSVHFMYSVGEYSTLVSVNPPNPEANINVTLIPFEGAQEIGSVISQREAKQKMTECIGDAWSTTYSPIYLETKGFFFVATNYDNEKIGVLNLETGECTESKWVPFRD